MKKFYFKKMNGEIELRNINIIRKILRHMSVSSEFSIENLDFIFTSDKRELIQELNSYRSNREFFRKIIIFCRFCNDKKVLSLEASENGYFDILKWIEVDKSISFKAGIFDNLKRNKSQNKHIFEIAANNGNLNNMKWLKENGYQWNRWVFSEAAKNGNLQIMIWLKENGCPWCKDTFRSAALNGNLENMKWLLQNNCPWDEWTFVKAVENGNIKNIEWLLKNGCPCNKYAHVYAAKKGNDTMVRWLKRNCPLNNNYSKISKTMLD